jgi:hypothetical protein
MDTMPIHGLAALGAPLQRSTPLARALFATLACTFGSTLFHPPELLGQVIRIQPTARATSKQLHNLAVVADAAMDRRGRVYIVDPTAPGIVITDAQLRRLGFHGRRGSGPGEFRDPVSVGVLANGRIVVLDRSLGRATVFAVADDGKSLRPQRTINFNIRSEAMCVLPGDELLIYGFDAGARLHVFSLDGRRLRSFARPGATLSPMAQGLLTRGKIACDLEHDRVVVSSRLLPSVETFRVSTGARIWAGVLEPFRSIRVRDQGTQVRISSERSGLSLVSGLLSTGDYLVFQTVYDSRTDGARADTIVTYVYSLEARRWLPRGNGAPLLFGLGHGAALSVHGRDRVDMEVKLNRVTSTSLAAAPRPKRRPD